MSRSAPLLIRLARFVAGEAAPPARVRVLLLLDATGRRQPRREATPFLPRPLFHGRCHWHTAPAARSDALPTTPVTALVAKRRPSYLARYFHGRGGPGAKRRGGEGSAMHRSAKPLPRLLLASPPGRATGTRPTRVRERRVRDARIPAQYRDAPLTRAAT